MKILGISGSIRTKSFNSALLDNAHKLLPDDITLQIQNIANVEHYNEDIDGHTKPDAVNELLSNIKEADALLFATPEYNHSIPGVLKNAIDWASRPAFNSVLLNKPCGMISASISPVGGVRAQAELLNVLSSTVSVIYPSIEFSVPNAHECFDDNGNLTDDTAKRRLQKYLDGFVSWVKNN